MSEQHHLVRELWLAAEEAGDYPQNEHRHTGIVICAGGPVMLTNAYVLLRVLRDALGCGLPIEIWHLGAHEMPGFIADKFVSMGCSIRDASAQCGEQDSQISDGWQLKAYALRHSHFEQVLLLDADQVPVRDPTEIFEWPEFRQTGAVVWPDIIDISEHNPAWEMLGLPPQRVRSWESGQMCVDRRRHWSAINIALEMNRRADSFYQIVYGDKDTFLLAWYLTGSNFAFVPERPYQSEYFLCQRDFSGKPLFQHRSNCKWSLTESNFQPDGFKLTAECEAFLEDLRKIWDGRIFHAPSRSVAARRAEQTIIGHRTFEGIIGTSVPFRIELLPGHQIGAGRSGNLTNWYVLDDDAGPELVFCDRHKEVATLTRDETGNWIGETIPRPRKDMQITLAAEEPYESRLHAPSGGVVADLVRSAISASSKASLDTETLQASIRLLARVDAGTASDVRSTSLLYATNYPDLSEQLRTLAAELEDGLSQASRSIARSPFTMIGDENYYVRD